MIERIHVLKCPVCGSTELFMDGTTEDGFTIGCEDCRYFENFKYGPYRENRNDFHSFTCTPKTIDET